MSAALRTRPAPVLEGELFDLTRRERLARDEGDWDELAKVYWADSVIRVTWFEGTVAEFIGVSKEQQAVGRGRSIHPITPAWLDVRGDRALIESRGQILIRPRVHGVECDVANWCRFFSRAERRHGEWRLVSFDSIYGKDRLDPVLPGAKVHLDVHTLSSYRASYRFLTYLNHRAGYDVPDDLPGDDRPDLVERFYHDAEAWLTRSEATSAPSTSGVNR